MEPTDLLWDDMQVVPVLYISVPFQRDLRWFNIALVECGVRVLKLFTFFALGEGDTLQSSI